MSFNSYNSITDNHGSNGEKDNEKGSNPFMTSQSYAQNVENSNNSTTTSSTPLLSTNTNTKTTLQQTSPQSQALPLSSPSYLSNTNTISTHQPHQFLNSPSSTTTPTTYRHTNTGTQPISSQKKSSPWIQKPLHLVYSEIAQSDRQEDIMEMVDSDSASPCSCECASPLQLEKNNLEETNVGQTHIKSHSPPKQNEIHGHGNKDVMERHLTLFDLVNIGMGSTIGSGIFVLCGFIAKHYAGPATCLSWAISGMAACLSGVCYAELACRMPSAGSSYVYVYSSMGELPAVVAAFCLSLEYVVTASAVARSWGDKVAEWLVEDVHVGVGFVDDWMEDENGGVDGGVEESWGGWMLRWILLKNQNVSGDVDTGISNSLSSFLFQNFNFMAFVVSTISILLLMNGVEESKRVANFFTVTKVLLVVFMSIMSLILMRPRENLVPFVPPEYGWSGVFRGATSSFFGYVGFDGVCCMSGEAINPQRNMPLSIILTLAGVTTLYILAALGLSGMIPYPQISDVSGFPDAFYQRDYGWAAQICAFGEVFTLPIVVLISILLQPRLQYAMAKDGLLPEIFARVDDSGNLWHGTVICGIIMILISSFVPFDHLNDMVSSGILIAFCMTDTALVILRHESPKKRPRLVERFLGVMNLASFTFGMCVTHMWQYFAGRVVGILSLVAMIVVMSGLYYACDLAQDFGGKERASPSLHSIKHGITYLVGQAGEKNSFSYFQTPGMPFIPLLGIFVNWYLITQMDLQSIGLLMCYLLLAVLFYYCYGFRHSVGRTTDLWDDYLPICS